MKENDVSCNDCLWCYGADRQGRCALDKSDDGGCPHFIPDKEEEDDDEIP